MSDSSWGIVLLGLGSALVGAGAHKAATDPVHQQQLQQAFEQGRAYQQQQGAWEIQNLQRQLWAKDIASMVKDAEIQRLNGIVENQAKALAQPPTQPRNSLPPGMGLWSENGNGHGPDS